MCRGLATTGQVLVLAIAVVIGTTTAGLLLTTLTAQSPPTQPVSVSATAAANGTIILTHQGGPQLDVRQVTLTVVVAGQSLTHQPPIPFFAATGFHGGPTGPFNSAADPVWTIGETAGFAIAGTNAPQLEPGDRVVIRVYRDGALIAIARSSVHGVTSSRDDRR